MRTFVHGLISIVCLLSFAAPAFAGGDFNVTVQVDASGFPIFSLYVTVTDAAGKPATGLTKDNFTVTEDGQPVVIDSFAGMGDPRPVDIVFVFDVTGSMADQIEGVKQTCVRFADKVKSSGRDYRLGLIPFRDNIPAIYQADGSLTADVQEFKRWISDLSADGGGDDPEVSLDALVRASQMKFRDKAQRILILITDAPPHQNDFYSRLTLDSTITTLTSASATAYVVGPDEAGYPRLASERGGKFYDIERNSDFTGLIDDIGTVIASQYRLTYHTRRPAPDGTLRGINVAVSREGKSGGGTAVVLEPHLLNIQSNGLIGLVMLALLGGVAAAPLFLRKRPIPAPGGASTPPLQPPITPPIRACPAPTWTPPPAPPIAPRPPLPSTVQMPSAPPVASAPIVAATTCWQCGKPLRPAARFCANCRAAQPQATAPVAAAAPTVCPQCRNALKLGAKFCNRCGQRIGN